MSTDKMIKAAQQDGAFMMRGLDKRVEDYAGSDRHEQARRHISEINKDIGAANRELVRSMMTDCLGITNIEMAKLSGMRHETIGKHKRAIVAEWKGQWTTPKTSERCGEDQPDNQCRGALDGECIWKQCPQLRDNEPYNSGRHCPLDVGCGRCGMIECQC